MLKRNDGFTLVELMIVIAIIAVIVIGGYVIMLKTICQGNFWYSEDGILKELKIDHPQITEVLKTTRNVFDKSIILVMENGEKTEYCLDTNIMWNYEFSKCEE